MKRASVFVLLFGLIACKHPSRLEAEKACLEWDAQEVSFNYERELLGFEKRQKFEQENPRPDAAYWDDEIIEWDEQKKLMQRLALLRLKRLVPAIAKTINSPCSF